MFKHTFAAAGLTALLAAPAFAGSPEPAAVDPVVPAPAPVYSPTWQGGYIGGELGYANVDTNVAGVDDTGLIGGLIAGYDWQIGSTVFGVGVDVDATDITLGGFDVDSVARLKFRVGQEIGSGLVYATGGAARANTSGFGNDSGWFVGGGYETFIAENVTLGGELLYHEFDNFNGSGVDADATTLQMRVAYRF